MQRRRLTSIQLLLALHLQGAQHTRWGTRMMLVCQGKWTLPFKTRSHSSSCASVLSGACVKSWCQGNWEKSQPKRWKQSWTEQHPTTSRNPVLHLPLWIRKTWDLMRWLKSPWLDNKWGSTWDLETVAYFWPLMDLVLICGFCLDLHWQSKLAAPQSIFKISEMIFPYNCLLL